MAAFDLSPLISDNALQNTCRKSLSTQAACSREETGKGGQSFPPAHSRMGQGLVAEAQLYRYLREILLPRSLLWASTLSAHSNHLVTFTNYLCSGPAPRGLDSIGQG